MGRHIEQALWEQWNKPHKIDQKSWPYIPLFISLSQNKGKTIDDILKAKGFIDHEINELKDNKVPFIFILDGYDELNEKKNMYELLLLNRYNCKIIYTCRSQYVADIEIPPYLEKSNIGRGQMANEVKITYIYPLDLNSQSNFYNKVSSIK